MVHWLKSQHSDWTANPEKDFFLLIIFPPMRPLEFITGHVIFKLRYDQIYQMKTTLIPSKIFFGFNKPVSDYFYVSKKGNQMQY